MRYQVKFTNQFKRDLKLAEKQGKDTERLFQVVERLANGETLEPKYRDHDLTGNYKGCRECHIAPDWLLVYEVVEDVLVLMLYRTGSHSELFR
ncbi:MAG: type II toxin-antitoxin system YafQ family toxin [Angelakisella sp.]|jgi:mRNA interferase YafQ|nr:type II toxin-antitoxin system YafQ family toxin [Angelakisella sp.]